MRFVLLISMSSFPTASLVLVRKKQTTTEEMKAVTYLLDDPAIRGLMRLKFRLGNTKRLSENIYCIDTKYRCGATMNPLNFFWFTSFKGLASSLKFPIPFLNQANLCESALCLVSVYEARSEELQIQAPVQIVIALSSSFRKPISTQFGRIATNRKHLYPSYLVMRTKSLSVSLYETGVLSTVQTLIFQPSDSITPLNSSMDGRSTAFGCHWTGPTFTQIPIFGFNNASTNTKYS